MDTDLNSLSLRELKDMQSRIAKAIASYEERKKREALAELEEKARDMGYNLAELLAMQSGKTTRKRALAAPKYANPANRSDTWTGRGRKPRWFVEGLASGRTPEDMTI